MEWGSPEGRKEANMERRFSKVLSQGVDTVEACEEVEEKVRWWISEADLCEWFFWGW